MDDRAFSTDLAFFDDVIRPSKFPAERVLFVLNQVDKAEPVRNWDESAGMPGSEQARIIAGKVDYVAEIFGIHRPRVIPVSANEKFNLSKLGEGMIFSLPGEKRVGLYKAIDEKQRTEEGKESTKRGMVQYLMDSVKEYGPTIVKAAAPFVMKLVVSLWPKLLKRG